MPKNEFPLSDRRRRIHALARSFLRAGMEFQAVGVLLPLLIKSERRRTMEILSKLAHDQVPRLAADVQKDMEQLARYRAEGRRRH